MSAATAGKEDGMAAKFMGTTDDVTQCECCGRADLKSTVAISLDGESDPVFYGVVCAARALGTTAKVVRSETKAADDAKHAAKQAEQARRWREHDRLWQAFLDSAAPGKERIAQIASLGGFKAASAAFEAAGGNRAAFVNSNGCDMRTGLAVAS